MGWFRLRVVDIDGGEATGSQLTLRWLLLVVDAMFLGAVGVVAMLATAKRQRVGDSLSDTVDVRNGRWSPVPT